MIEIVVVLAIAAVVTSITLGGFTELRMGHRRTSCQSNMTQIYQAARLYASDQGAFPFYAPPGTGAAAGERGIGLWALYTYAKSNDADTPAPLDDSSLTQPYSKPVGRYLRNASVLHCPEDDTHDSLFQAGSTSAFNLEYLSYQVLDDFDTPTDATDDQNTYQSERAIPGSVPATALLRRRQLLVKNTVTNNLIAPPSNTVVTWCRWHRADVGGRDYDNVLFYDGSVQYLPRLQAADDTASCDPFCTPATDWKRVPRPLLTP